MTNLIIKSIELGRAINTSAAIAMLKKHYPLISSDPATFCLSDKKRQYLIITRYGVATIVNWSKILEEKVLAMLSPFVDNPYPITENFEESEVSIVPHSPITALFDKTILPRFDEKALLIIGLLLSQSVGLESYEKRIEFLLEKLNKQIRELRKIRFFLPLSPFVHNTVEMMDFEQEIISNLGVLDKPDATWENKDLDYLYSKLGDNLEISDRTRILSEKIGVLRRNTEIALNIINAHKEYVLELAIVGLIVFEILISLWEKIVK